MQEPHLKTDVGFPTPAHRLAVWPKNHVKNTKPAHFPPITILLSCLICLKINILCTSAKNKALIRYIEWWGLKKLLKEIRITFFPIPWVTVEIPIENFCYLQCWLSQDLKFMYRVVWNLSAAVITCARLCSSEKCSFPASAGVLLKSCPHPQLKHSQGLRRDTTGQSIT